MSLHTSSLRIVCTAGPMASPKPASTTSSSTNLGSAAQIPTAATPNQDNNPHVSSRRTTAERVAQKPALVCEFAEPKHQHRPSVMAAQGLLPGYIATDIEGGMQSTPATPAGTPTPSSASTGPFQQARKSSISSGSGPTVAAAFRQARRESASLSGGNNGAPGSAVVSSPRRQAMHRSDEGAQGDGKGHKDWSADADDNDKVDKVDNEGALGTDSSYEGSSSDEEHDEGMVAGGDYTDIAPRSQAPATAAAAANRKVGLAVQPPVIPVTATAPPTGSSPTKTPPEHMRTGDYPTSPAATSPRKYGGITPTTPTVTPAGGEGQRQVPAAATAPATAPGFTHSPSARLIYGSSQQPATAMSQAPSPTQLTKPPSAAATAPSPAAQQPTAAAAAAATGGAPKPKGKYKLLCVYPVLPHAMRRDMWSLNDFGVVKQLHKGYAASVYKVGLLSVLSCWFICCVCIPFSLGLPPAEMLVVLQHMLVAIK